MKKIKNIECPYESSYSNRYWRNSDLKSNRITVKTYLPSVYFKDLNHDGIKDAYCRYKNIVYYYISGNNDTGRKIPFLTQTIKSYPLNLQKEYTSDFFLEDMDSDGVTDAVFSIVSGMGLKVKTETMVFWGKGDIPDSSSSERWTDTGGFFTPLLLDKQGQKLLLIPSMNLGVSFVLSYILEKKMLIKGNIYSLTDPENHRKHTKISSHNLNFQAEDNLFPGFTVGDFNNDKIFDVALATEFNEIMLHYGDPDMSGKKKLSMPLPGYGIIYTIFNPFGTHELLIYLPQSLPGFNSLRVYLVRFNS